MDEVLKQQWHPACKVSELTTEKPIGISIMGLDLVVWRDHKGVHAWDDICVHRGMRLSLGKVCENKFLECPYHGWLYEGSGQCVKIPAHSEQKIPNKARAKAVYRAKEHAGLVWVNLSENPKEPPTIAEHGDPSFRTVTSGPFRLHGSGPRAIENSLDVAHFPFVHGGFLGSLEHPKIDDYEVERTEDAVYARNVRVYQPDPDGTGVGQDISYDYGVIAPLTMYFVKQVGPENRLSIMFTIRPESETVSVGYFSTMMNYDHDTPPEEIDRFHSFLLEQDRIIVENQRPELLPMDLAAELHLRSDAMSIAYRQYLKAKGLSFGTA
ncbi:MAG: aromatic ring-hydroxylating dioxygenase subunit alpha [Verrucomicrobiae bacterium]|nr:aromatic ring-hydroxylating dioxygenase subunit alpha [Verrucomicrobiae bacterium]